MVLAKVADEYGLYVGGIQKGYTQDVSTANFAGDLNIGRYGSNLYHMIGTMDDILIEKGNRFGASPQNDNSDTIVVPTAPLRANTDTKLLLHFDGADAATAPPNE